MVVYNVLICAHSHDCCFYLYFMQDFLLGYLHHSDCPAFISVFTIESVVYCAHRSFTKLLGESIELVGVIWQKVYSFDLLVELVVSKECVIGYFLLSFETSHDLDHDLGIVLDHFLANVVFGEELHHVRSKTLDAARTVEVHFQMHLVFEVLRPT